MERDFCGWSKLARRSPGGSPEKGRLLGAPGTLSPRPDGNLSARGHGSRSRPKAETCGQRKPLQRSQRRQTAEDRGAPLPSKPWSFPCLTGQGDHKAGHFQATLHPGQGHHPNLGYRVHFLKDLSPLGRLGPLGGEEQLCPCWSRVLSMHLPGQRLPGNYWG